MARIVHATGMKSNPQTPFFLFGKLVGKRHFADLLTACATTSDTFQLQYVPVAAKFADCVQDLPLSPDVYNRPGGGLQFGLQAGLLAVRLCDAVIFAPQATAQERQYQDPQYRWCAYCAALASAYLICAGEVEVILESGEVHSFAGSKPLGNAKSSFEALWKKSPALPQQAGLIYLQGFFFPGQFAHLSPTLLAELSGAINPAMSTASNESPLARVVRMSLSRVLDFQRQADAKVIVGTAPAPMADLPPEPAQTPPQTPATAPVPEQVAADAPQTTPPSAEGVAAVPTDVPPPVATAEPAVAEPAPPPAPEPGEGIDTKVVEWVRALASNHDLDGDVQVMEEGLFINKKAMVYGGTSGENFKALYDAGVVLKKGDTGDTLCCLELAVVYAAALAKVKSK